MSNEDQPLTRIALVGEGHEVWPVAAVLSGSLPDSIELIVVEDTRSTGDQSALAIPLESRFHESVGLTINDVIGHTNANVGLGTECIGFQGDGSSFFVAPSGSLPLVAGHPLHQIMLRASYQSNGPEDLAHLMQPFRFCARSAMAGKMALPSDAPMTPLIMLGPTLQIGRGEYAALLKNGCEDHVSEVLQTYCTGVRKDGQSGAIESISLEGEEDLAADMFIDVSGGLSSFMPEEDKPVRKSLSQYLLFDTLLDEFDPKKLAGEHQHIVAHALESGLRIETPLREGLATELLFSSQYDDGEINIDALEGYSQRRLFEAFEVDNPWTRNFVAMGRASAQLGPYQSADMRLLQEQALQLASFIPVNRNKAVEAAEFNQQHRTILEEIRDFTILPFALNSRVDTLWRDIRASALPDSLQLRIDQFKSRGRFVSYDHELFDRQNWIETMIGMEVIPERYDHLLRSIEMKPLVPQLRQMVADFTRTIETMPGHDEFMKRYPVV